MLETFEDTKGVVRRTRWSLKNFTIIQHKINIKLSLY